MPEGKIQVVELAKNLGITSARLMTLLGDLGVKVTSEAASVDPALESRLRGLIRRPSTGGRGQAAARPEPTWLTSLRWPKSIREPEEPEAAPEARSAAAKPAVETAPAAKVEGEAAAAPAARRKLVVPEPRGGDGLPRPEGETETPIEMPAGRPERVGPTLPSGRTPAPPPPPPPVRRTGERTAAPSAARPAPSPVRPAAAAPRPATAIAPAPVGPGAALSGAPAPIGPSAAAGPRRLAPPAGSRAGAPGGGPAAPGPASQPAAVGPVRPARPGSAGRPAPVGPRLEDSRPAGPRPAGYQPGPGRVPGGYPARPGQERPVRPPQQVGGGRPSFGPRPYGAIGAGRPGPGQGRPAGPGRLGAGPGRLVPAPPGGPGAPVAVAGRPDRRRDAQRRGAGTRGRTEDRVWRGEDAEAERRVARGRHGGGRRGEVRPKVEEPERVRATEVVIEGPITVRELAERMGVSGAELIKSLIRLGIVASLNQVLDPESARIAVSEMGLTVHLRAVDKAEGGEEGAPAEAPAEEEEGAEAVPRPPVVTVMGHVDHGKTSLLDAIRKTNVTAGEAGGITQHIGASTVDWQGKRIVFLDTPGHEAFTAMRARGAKVTDIAILVVAADDGVMPQTLEAINHARAAKVPIIVALNKIDKPNALPDRVKKQLSENGLTPEDWGGDTIVVPVSAKERTGLDDLLDMVILVAEMSELKADPTRRGRGIVIETRLDKGLGPVASVLVQSGTLRLGDPVVAGTAFGRVRAMVDDKGNRLDEAGPSTPVEVIGLDELPAAGDLLQVLADEKMAREIAAQRDLKKRAQEMAGTRAAANLADLFRQIREGARKQLNLVLKADVQGSLEALRQSFEKLEEPEIGIKIIHTGVGGVSETDVMLAAASDAIIIAFNVTPDAGARQAAEREGVDVRTYRIIYDAINDVKSAIKGLRAPTFQEVVLGHAEVRQLFKIPKVGTIAGCYVTDGKISRKNKIRVVRDGVVVQEAAIASLKHVKDDVREIAAGFECGIGLENFQDIKQGDVLEAFAMEEVGK